MSIRARVFGGFGLILLLTVAVAAIGWHSLTGFARRVDTANAAQLLAGEIGELALATDRALKSDDVRRDGALTAAIGRVRASAGAFSGRLADDPPAAAAAAGIAGALDGFEAAVKAFGTQKATARALQDRHAALIAELQTNVAGIGTAQERQLAEAGKALDKALADQKTATNTAVVVAFAIRSALEMQVLQVGYLAGDGDDGNLELQSKVNSVAVLLRRLGAMTSVETVEPALTALNAYGAKIDQPVAAGGKAALGDDLAPLFGSLIVGLRQIEQAQNNAQTAAQVTLRQQQDKVASATSLLVASGKAISAPRSRAAGAAPDPRPRRRRRRDPRRDRRRTDRPGRDDPLRRHRRRRARRVARPEHQGAGVQGQHPGHREGERNTGRDLRRPRPALGRAGLGGAGHRRERARPARRRARQGPVAAGRRRGARLRHRGGACPPDRARHHPADRPALGRHAGARRRRPRHRGAGARPPRRDRRHGGHRAGVPRGADRQGRGRPGRRGGSRRQGRAGRAPRRRDPHLRGQRRGDDRDLGGGCRRHGGGPPGR